MRNLEPGRTSFTKIQQMCNIKSCVYKPNQEISNMPISPIEDGVELGLTEVFEMPDSTSKNTGFLEMAYLSSR